MTAPNAGYDRDRVMRIIMTRCGDVLTDADLALLAGEPDDTLPWQIAEQILTVLNTMMDRPHRSGPAAAVIEDEMTTSEIEAISSTRPEVFREFKAKVENHTAFAAWVFMILCASRPSEALGAQWSEIDLDERQMEIPPRADESQ